VAHLDPKTGHLTSLSVATELEHATWLEPHPTLPVLYSVGPSVPGATHSQVYSFAIDPGTGMLKEINHADAGGDDATHLGIDPTSRTLFVANHGSGNVTALSLQPNGSLGTVVADERDDTVGTDQRQQKPAAHAVIVDPTHRFLLVSYFSADRVSVYRIDSRTRSLTPAPTPFETFPPASGPRHLVFGPSGHTVYVNNEISGEIRSFQWDATGGRLRPLQVVSAYPEDYTGRRSAAEILPSRDGRSLYLSLRGDQNSIVAYSIDKRSGRLTEIQRISSQGKNPWSFGIDPSGRWLLVANPGSGSLAVLGIDTATGQLTATGKSVSIPAGPVAVAFYSP
jgi:6-phosphogluconolactonase